MTHGTVVIVEPGTEPHRVVCIECADTGLVPCGCGERRNCYYAGLVQCACQASSAGLDVRGGEKAKL